MSLFIEISAEITICRKRKDRNQDMIFKRGNVKLKGKHKKAVVREWETLISYSGLSQDCRHEEEQKINYSCWDIHFNFLSIIIHVQSLFYIIQYILSLIFYLSFKPLLIQNVLGNHNLLW